MRARLADPSSANQPLLRWLPGGAVGAGGATTGGLKLLPPVGLMFFSVGETDVGVVVVVVLVGAGLSLPLQPAVNAPIAMIALPLATSARRRANRRELMLVWSYLVHIHCRADLRAVV